MRVVVVAQDLSAHLQHLSANATAYEHLLRYKRGPEHVQKRFRELWLTKRPWYQCRLCSYVWLGTPRKFWHDDSCEMSAGFY